MSEEETKGGWKRIVELELLTRQALLDLVRMLQKENNRLRHELQEAGQELNERDLEKMREER